MGTKNAPIVLEKMIQGTQLNTTQVFKTFPLNQTNISGTVVN